MKRPLFWKVIVPDIRITWRRRDRGLQLQEPNNSPYKTLPACCWCEKTSGGNVCGGQAGDLVGLPHWFWRQMKRWLVPRSCPNWQREVQGAWPGLCQNRQGMVLWSIFPSGFHGFPVSIRCILAGTLLFLTDGEGLRKTCADSRQGWTSWKKKKWKRNSKIDMIVLCQMFRSFCSKLQCLWWYLNF